MSKQKYANIEQTFPIMEHLSTYLKHNRIVSGLKIGWHCHLTWITALAVKCLIESDAKIFLSECNPLTSESESIELMKKLGAIVYCGTSSCESVLKEKPDVISDTGLVLISQYLQTAKFNLLGACEITTSGITRLRNTKNLPIPVININNSRLKTKIENFHGVGDGIVDALSLITDKAWTGRKACVVGYGQVGAGIAHYLTKIGAVVTVVEKDPTRQLIAHYDGFLTSSLTKAISESELLVTATGQSNLIGEDEWHEAADGLIVLNAGHWPDEINPNYLEKIALSKHSISKDLEEFTLSNSKSTNIKKIYLATSGSPVNVALCSGNPEPTLIHLTTEILCLEFLAKNVLGNDKKQTKGEIPVPPEVEYRASQLALSSLGL